MGSNLNKWNLDKMQQYCNDNAKGYVVLEEKRVDKGYQNQQWALVKCPNKNHESYWVWWNHFTHDRRCKYCNTQKVTLKWNEEKAYAYFNSNGYTPLTNGLYKNVDTTIPCYDENGYILMISISNLKRAIKHNKFNFSIIKNNPYALENIKLFCKLERPEYEYVNGEYKTIKSVITWRYNGKFYDNLKHNREFECTVDSFMNAYTKHPDLTSSVLSLKVHEVLDELNIDYETEKTFDDCVDKIKLRYDFYFEFNGKRYCLEADGEQHFRPVDSWGGIEAFEQVKKRDNIKNEFCLNNEIILIRIPFDKVDNAKNIILNYLKSTAPLGVGA